MLPYLKKHWHGERTTPSARFAPKDYCYVHCTSIILMNSLETNENSEKQSTAKCLQHLILYLFVMALFKYNFGYLYVVL